MRYSLFLPILCYCCELLGNACITNVHSITVVQKVVRQIRGVGRLHHTNLLFYRCRVLKFQDLVDLKMCSIMYKAYNNMPVPANVQCFFTKHANLRPSRVQCKYVYVTVSVQILLSRDAYKFKV